MSNKSNKQTCLKKVKAMVQKGTWVAAIKVYREGFGCSLKEAWDACKMLNDQEMKRGMGRCEDAERSGDEEMNNPFTCGECVNYDPKVRNHCKTEDHFADGPDGSVGLCDEFQQTDLSIKERVV